MHELIIDGKPVAFNSGETILQAAKKAGIYIPTLCWDERLKPSGACRMCVVEVEGSHRLAAACHTPARSGWVVHTASQKVHDARKLIVELMLASHPGEEECSDCVKCGSCVLQSWAYAYGLREPAMPMTCRHCEKPYCKEVCQSGAIIKKGNVVFIDYKKCNGCRECAMVCPSGIILWDGKKMTVRKCDLCIDETSKGGIPACASVCPSGALEFDDMDVITGRKKKKAAEKIRTAALAGNSKKDR